MIDIHELREGDKVKIVDAWCEGCGENNEGRMDKYLGRLVTVRRVYDNSISIEEDQGDRGGGWSWFPAALEPAEDHLEYEPESDEDFFSSLQTILGL